MWSRSRRDVGAESLQHDLSVIGRALRVGPQPAEDHDVHSLCEFAKDSLISFATLEWVTLAPDLVPGLDGFLHNLEPGVSVGEALTDMMCSGGESHNRVTAPIPSTSPPPAPPPSAPLSPSRMPSPGPVPTVGVSSAAASAPPTKRRKGTTRSSAWWADDLMPKKDLPSGYVWVSLLLVTFF